MVTVKKPQGHFPYGFRISSRPSARRSKGLWPVLAKVLTGALLAFALLVGSLGSTWSGGQAAASPTSAAAGGRASLPKLSGVAASSQTTGPVGIVVKLVPGAHLTSNGTVLPDEQTQSSVSAQGAGDVSGFVTGAGLNRDLSKFKLHQRSAIDALGVHALDVSDQATLDSTLASLRSDPGVLWAEKTQPVYAAVVPNDPYYSSQWALPKVGLPTAWNSTTGSAGVTVAIVDTGLDENVADFAGRIVSPYSVVSGSGVWPAWNDTFGHGSAVAGVAASQGNNATGIAGVAWGIKIMPVKISTNGSSDDVTLASGIVYAVDHGANVINVSFGGLGGSLTMQSAVNYALAHNVVVVASAGNSGPGAGVAYPAAYPGVISVGATDSNDAIASFSSTGPGLVLSAPGVSILTLNVTSSEAVPGYWDGTSFSSPMVAGVVALMRSVNSSLTPSQVMTILEQTALDLGTPGYDQSYGYGRVRADLAVAAATTTSSTTSTTLPSGGTTRYEETNVNLLYAGTWTTLSGSTYSGGSFAYTSTAGASVTATFTGTHLTWIAKTGPSYGMARVTLDGGTPVMVDLYNPNMLAQQQVWNTGTLVSGNHTVKIEWTGQKNALSSYAYVDLDALDVTGTLTSALNTSSSLSPSGTLFVAGLNQPLAYDLVGGRVILFGGS